MKKLLTSIALLIAVISINAQTNTPPIPTLSLTNVPESGKTSGSIELTLGGAGTEIKGESTLGFDFSISTNPFKVRPEIWLGIGQGLYWEPSFAGSTDVFADWSWNVWKDTLYLNTGWSVGVLYDPSEIIWRTGPEAYFQYYTSDNAFIYAGINWDFMSKGNNGIRYCFGIGLSF